MKAREREREILSVSVCGTDYLITRPRRNLQTFSAKMD